jgi:hypothetical protein
MKIQGEGVKNQGGSNVIFKVKSAHAVICFPVTFQIGHHGVDGRAFQVEVNQFLGGLYIRMGDGVRGFGNDEPK